MTIKRREGSRKRFVKRTLLATGLATLFGSGAAHAAGGAGIKLFGGDFSYNGLLRVETAFSTSSQAAEANQYGDRANGVSIQRDAGNPATGWTTTLTPGGLNTILQSIPGFNLGAVNPAGQPRGVTNQTATSDTFKRYVPSKDNTLNYHVIRFEATPSISWGSVSLITRVRALYDPGSLGYHDFDYGDYNNPEGVSDGKIEGGEPRQFHGSPDFFGYGVRGKQHPLFFEYSDKHYMVDLPAFFLQWTNGNVTVRAGNQTVAWGQLLFFRIMDQANGLDLRRHLFLDRAIEEYADERESAPGIRVTWQTTDQVTSDFFIQQFIPTILPNVNTPYNIVPSQFTIHDHYWDGDYYKKFNYGMRFKGEFGNMSAQAMYTSKLDQLGSIRWTKSGVNKALPNDNYLGAAFNQYCNLTAATAGYAPGNGCGPFLADTPFEAAPAGVFTAEEWFNYAGFIKLDALDGLNQAVIDFPAAQRLLAQPIGHNVNAANNELDAFFMAGDGLRGHIERDYYREHVFGLGFGYVTEAEPGSIFDQIIMNVETAYTKGRTFTAVDLGHGYSKRDDLQIGFVAEKYQRFSQSFPATYLVFQYLWQKESDLAGLLLDGYGSENFSDQGIKLNPAVPTSANPKINPGVNDANYVVFAALQPTDAYIFEYSVAALIDVQGGVLIQPAVQWKPRGNMTVNLFYNYIESDAWGGNANKNLMSLIADQDEIGLRLGFQF